MNDDSSLRRKEETEDARLIREGAAGEEFSSEDPATRLADGVVTRAQALKLAGFGGAGFLFTLLWPADADARRRGRRKKKKRRRSRRTAEVTPTPNPLEVNPGTPFTLTITNPSDSSPLIVSEVRLLDSSGKVIAIEDLTDPVTIAPNGMEVVPVTITVDDLLDPNDSLVDAEKLRLIDGRGVPITVVDENGVTVGTGDLDVTVVDV